MYRYLRLEDFMPSRLPSWYSDALLRIADAMVDDALAMTDEEILSEEDPEELTAYAASMRRKFDELAEGEEVTKMAEEDNMVDAEELYEPVDFEDNTEDESEDEEDESEDEDDEDDEDEEFDEDTEEGD